MKIYAKRDLYHWNSSKISRICIIEKGIAQALGQGSWGYLSVELLSSENTTKGVRHFICQSWFRKKIKFFCELHFLLFEFQTQRVATEMIERILLMLSLLSTLNINQNFYFFEASIYENCFQEVSIFSAAWFRKWMQFWINSVLTKLGQFLFNFIVNGLV